MSTIEKLMEHGLVRDEDEPLHLHHLINCRMFAKTVWVDKLILKAQLNFTAEYLHDLIHANEEMFYDNCPGEAIVKQWFKDFAKEVC